MHTSTLHFWLWFAMLGVAPLLVGVPLWRPALRLPAVLYPILVAGLLWLHGVWFNPPNNFGVLDDYGFFGFWFKTHGDVYLNRNVPSYVLMSLPVAVVTPWAMVALRRHRSAKKRVWVATPLLVLAFLFLRGIPDHLVDLLHHRPFAFENPVEDVLPGVVVRLGFALPFLIAGLAAWILGTRSAPGTPGRISA